jgi:DNA-binding GntR family transcriptional regulator
MSKRPQLVSVREQIYEGIKEMILTNLFEPGEIVPIEKMAEEFGVSPTPIREALIRLEGFGLVTLVPNKGARVAEISEQDVRDIWQMRTLLEPFAAGLSAAQDLEKHLDHLEAKIQGVLEGKYDFETYVQTDVELHQTLCEHVPNQLLKETVLRVHQLSMRMRYFPEHAAQIHDSVVAEVSREHQEIIAAVRSKDSRAASEAMRLHILNGEARAINAIKAREASG